MSRTKRSTPKHKGYMWFRTPRHLNARIGEHYAAQELEEYGFHSSNRQKTRANITGPGIVDDWDDLSVAAHNEMDYKNDQYLPKQTF